MMGIFDDQLQDIDCDMQIEPFNLAQLSQMITMLEQKKQGFNNSSVSDKADVVGKTDYSTQVHPKILDLLIH